MQGQDKNNNNVSSNNNNEKYNIVSAQLVLRVKREREKERVNDRKRERAREREQVGRYLFTVTRASASLRACRRARVGAALGARVKRRGRVKGRGRQVNKIAIALGSRSINNRARAFSRLVSEI